MWIVKKGGQPKSYGTSFDDFDDALQAALDMANTQAVDAGYDLKAIDTFENGLDPREHPEKTDKTSRRGPQMTRPREHATVVVTGSWPENDPPPENDNDAQAWNDWRTRRGIAAY